MSVTKHTQIEKAITEREAKRAALLEQKITLAEHEKQARYEHLDATPAKSAYTRGAPAQELRLEREAIDRTLEGIEAEITTLHEQSAKASAEFAATELKDLTAKGPKLTKAEFAIYERAGELYADLLAAFNDLVEVQEERSAITGHVARTRLAELVATVEPGLASTWEQSAYSPLTPVGDFGAFLKRLQDGTSDPNVRGGGEHNLAPGTHPSEILTSLLPDLRGAARSSTVGTRSGGPNMFEESLIALGYGVNVPGGGFSR